MIGKLRNRVQIKDIQLTPNGSGGFNYVYTDYSDVLNLFTNRAENVETTTCDFLGEFLVDRFVWAEVIQKDGFRGLTGSQIDLDNYTEFTFRYEDVSDISKTWNLFLDDRQFTIHSYYVIREKRTWIKVKALESK